MKYLLGSGFFNSSFMAVPPQEMAKAWLACIRKHADPPPARIVIVTAAGHTPDIGTHPDVTVIKCDGNLGNLAAGTMKHAFAGWMAPVMITAMIAYNEELDYVFQEQDCLAFGPYITRGFSDIGDGQMALGRPLMQMGQPATQSLFFIRHAYIWQFARDYLTLGPDDNEWNQGEKKFARLRANNPTAVRVLSFGSDRDRPIPWHEPVVAAQQWSRTEFDEAKRRRLIP